MLRFAVRILKNKDLTPSSQRACYERQPVIFQIVDKDEQVRKRALQPGTLKRLVCLKFLL